MEAANDIRIAYITMGSMEAARELGSFLVDSKVAACANIVPGMESIYSWKGKVEKDLEVILLAKTTLEMMEKLTKMVKEKHDYECPCIIWLPIEGGNPDYLAWLREQVRNG